MPIVVTLDVMLARRKTRSEELAERIGITKQNVSLLKSGKVRACASTPWRTSAARSIVSRATFWNTGRRSRKVVPVQRS